MDDGLIVDIQQLPLNGSHALCVFLKGHFSVSKSVNLEAVVFDNIKDQTLGVLINLKEVEMIDSNGLGILTTISIKAGRRNLHLILVGANERLVNIIKTTHLDSLFTMSETQEEALAFFIS